MRKTIVPQTDTLILLLGDHASTSLSTSLGSTSLAVDASTGEVVETRYKPWGEVRFTTTGETLPTRYTFTGQYSYMDDEATDLGAAGFGLIFYNARWYDPMTGRFAQADCIIPNNIQGLDRYAYANNSPVNYVDPSGHKPEDPFLPPVQITVNLATSIPQNYWVPSGPYRAAQYMYMSSTGMNPGNFNLCGDVSFSMILETVTRTENRLRDIFDARLDKSWNVPTDRKELAHQAEQFGWKAVSAYRTDIKNADSLVLTLYGMLDQGHYLIVGVTQNEDGPGLVNKFTGVKHWVVVVGIDSDYVYIINPFTNSRQRYTWQEFYQSWTNDWVELTPPPPSPPNFASRRNRDTSIEP
ncbi:MAG: RHS repeat-associated core domain-containing protein [Chloroflexota bacterium]